jgi:hypothetical protein
MTGAWGRRARGWLGDVDETTLCRPASATLHERFGSLLRPLLSVLWPRHISLNLIE